jgi:hypothetical protein
MTDATRSRPRLAGEVAVVLLLVFVYDRVRDLAATRSGEALANGRRLLDTERWLHLDLEHSLNHVLTAHRSIELGASWYYQLMHLTVTLLVLLWLYRRHAGSYRAARTSLVAINLAGLAVFWLFPVAPPRLLPGAGFVDSTVARGVADHATTVTPDLYAAMPSLHIAWATWVAIQVLANTRRRLPQALALVHLALTATIVLATANHYLIDVLAGATLAYAVTVHRPRQLAEGSATGQPTRSATTSERDLPCTDVGARLGDR